MADPTTIYRLLLRLYPARFREEYGTPMELQFRDDYRNERGTWPRLAFWLHAFRDLAISIPSEILREVWQDLRRSARVYRRRPLTTALALIALALAIGVTTGIFSVVSALLLRGLPFREPERLVQIRMFSQVAGHDGVKKWGLRSAYLEGAAEYISSEVTLGQVAEATHVKVAETSANFFGVLGAEPVLGRAFAADEDVPGRDKVVVIGHGLWRRRFNADPRVLGSSITLNGVPLIVIGVAPPALDYPAKTEVWTATANHNLPRQAGFVTSEILGRLKPGIGIAQAQGMFLAEMRRAYPESTRQVGLSYSRLTSLRNELAGPVRQAFMVLLIAATLVLMIACANVALLLLSRTAERRPELAIRGGARREPRTLGPAVNYRGHRSDTSRGSRRSDDSALGDAPCRQRSAGPVGRASVHHSGLAGAGVRGGGGRTDWRALWSASCLLDRAHAAVARSWFGASRVSSAPVPAGCELGLIAAQAALTLILLAGSITLGRGFLRLLGADLGYQTDHLVSMTVSVAGTPYEKLREAQFWDAALDRLRAVPGVEAAGAVHYLPLVESDWQYMGGRYKFDSGEDLREAVVVNPVTSGYFQAIGTNVVAGRDFTAAERRGKELVAIVNEEFARRIGPVASVVGRRMTRPYHATYAPTFTIVGVVRTVRLGGPASVPPLQVYLPVEQRPQGAMTFVARVRGNAADYVRLCRSAVHQVDRGIPVYDVKTLQQRLDEVLARPRFYATAILFLGAFALLLAVIGIYGVAAHSITQRTHELGVRVALGARPARLRTSLLRQSLMPVLVGMIVGVAGAIGLGKYLHHLMESAEPLGTWTCVAAGLVLSATAAVAVWFATSRVTQVDPMIALKSE